MHVDDVIGGGGETFDRIMTAVRKEPGTLAIFVSTVARFRRCQMDKKRLTWNSTSMSLNKYKCPRPTKPGLIAS